MIRRPISTYRLQIRRDFDLDAAAAVTGYLRDLGVSWVYLSPILTATGGSDHGYDVVDPSRVDPARGGAEGFARFVDAARSEGLGILVDIVPNHMGVGVPRENPWWWDVLMRGRDSRHAVAFDIDWTAGDGRVRLPILGAPLDDVIDEIEIDTDAAPDAPHGTLRYFDHVLPLAPGTARAGDTRAVLAAQNYELRFWRDEAAELNYRRFFAVTSLAGVRVEIPGVFAESHAEILRWIREGLADGLRIDHPDGLADPAGYLEQLAAMTGDAYVLVEKILERGEQLPGNWKTDGTTGYDALGEFDRVLVDPAGEGALDEHATRLRGRTEDWHDLIHTTKRMIADTIQVAEIRRLVRELPEPIAQAEDALAELLACFPVYRSYLPAGVEHLHAAAAEASARRPDLAGAIEALLPLLTDAANPAARRFQQTTGPVMAKGVEDTAFYRFTRLGTLTEVGGDPSVFALSAEEFHRAQIARQAAWPHAMTTLSTHDTKRGEDVRARLSVIAEIPDRWTSTLDELRAIASTGHGPFDDLLWQAIVGSWPATADRLHAYAEKAAREAAEVTGWWSQDAEFERRMHDLVDAAFGTARAVVERFVDEIAGPGRSNSLSAKLLQLAAPGVPDVYQGSELWEMSLVDPDNRRPVDFALRRRMLSAIDGGALPPIDASGAAKLLVTSRALRLRRERPELFTRYTPMPVVGEAASHAVAFDRGGALAVATRLPVGLSRRGGWGDTALLRHAGPTVDVITGRRFDAGAIPLAELLSSYPVALLAAPSSGDERTTST